MKSFVGPKQASMISDMLTQLLLSEEGIKISYTYCKHSELFVA